MGRLLAAGVSLVAGGAAAACGDSCRLFGTSSAALAAQPALQCVDPAERVQLSIDACAARVSGVSGSRACQRCCNAGSPACGGWPCTQLVVQACGAQLHNPVVPW